LRKTAGVVGTNPSPLIGARPFVPASTWVALEPPFPTAVATMPDVGVVTTSEVRFVVSGATTARATPAIRHTIPTGRSQRPPRFGGLVVV
jgi:hypothetical protein